MKNTATNKLMVLMMSFAIVLSSLWLAPFTASAETAHITDVRAASGKGAYAKLEKAGYSVMSTALNMRSAEGKRIYVGYKTGSGAAVRGIVSDSSKLDGVKYKSAGAGLYITKDKKAGTPLVGLDVLMPSAEDGKNPPAITNDGSEIVRNGKGKPADFQSGGKTVYLAMIRADSVRPYISEVVTVTGEDKRDAVYKASTYGYDYYIEGDIDGSKKTYTIIAYERTADPEKAITNVTSISKGLLKMLIQAQNGGGEEEEAPAEEEPQEQEEEPQEEEPYEEPEEEAASEDGEVPADESEEDVEPSEDEQDSEQEQEEEPADESYDEQEEELPEQEESTPEEEETVPDEGTEPVEAEMKLNGDAIDISGIEYTRMSSKVVQGKRPYYLYATKDKAAGNPITMFYIGGEKEPSETTLGIWARGYFSTKGVSNAYSYIANEDSLSELEKSTEVYIRKPIIFIDNNSEEEFDLAARLSKISILTAKAGLPDDSLTLNGLIEPSYEPPMIVENDRDNPESDLPASAFGKANIALIVLGAVLLILALRFVTKKQKNTDKAEK